MRANSVFSTLLILSWVGSSAMADSPSPPQQAAQSENVIAQLKLAPPNGTGTSSLRDEVAAVESLKRAADQGNSDAQTNLGIAFFNGTGVPRNYAQAMKWFRMAAEQSDAVAQQYLAVGYFTGRGVCGTKNYSGERSCISYVYAYEWFNTAALLGNEKAAQQRDLLEKNMPVWDVAHAQDLSMEWWTEHN